jgi:hypothetical protein
MADERLRDLEQAVKIDPANESLRVALDAERTRRGLPSLWGYAPRWCPEENGAQWRHMAGAGWACNACFRPQNEAIRHVQTVDMPAGNSSWQRRARGSVALVLRVVGGASPREVRAMLREVRPGKGAAAIERQWFTREAVRAFPFLARKKGPLGPEDSPLFAEKGGAHAR